MLTVGVDAHKRVNMAVAVDATGRELARWRGANNAEGWRQLAAWAAAQGEEARWGLEGAWNYGRGLAQFLVELGATVYEVNALDRRRSAAGAHDGQERRPRRPRRGAGGLAQGGHPAAGDGGRCDRDPGPAGRRARGGGRGEHAATQSVAPAPAPARS